MNSPGFTASTIDRADNLRLMPDKIAALAASPQARLMRLKEIEPEFTPDGRLSWISPIETADMSALVFLGIDGEIPLFAPLGQSDGMASAISRWTMLDAMAPEDAALWAAARSLSLGHNRHGFCSNCGAVTVPFRAGWGRRCAACVTDHFPRVDPVVIMLPEYQGRVLVGRQPQFPPRRYSALAGCIEPGESIEGAVAREIMEEAGIKVSEVRYVGSQPWPFPSTLMMACLATAASDEILLDTTELEDAMWVDAGQVEAALAGDADAPFIAPPSFAIAHSLLVQWLEEVRGRGDPGSS
jgi:NAD+ diphosphatase